MQFWNVATHHRLGAPVTPVPPLTGHQGVIPSVAFSPDGRTLAIVDVDVDVRLWDVATHRQIGPPLTTPDGLVSSVAFSSDGRTRAIVGAEVRLEYRDPPPDTSSHVGRFSGDACTRHDRVGRRALLLDA